MTYLPVPLLFPKEKLHQLVISYFQCFLRVFMYTYLFEFLQYVALSSDLHWFVNVVTHRHFTLLLLYIPLL